ncbi:MAG: di-heme oxidoredictase family protein [Acidobacteriota bacterium]
MKRILVWLPILALAVDAVLFAAPLGREVAVPRHLQDGQEFQVDRYTLIAYGKLLFDAVWTDQEGGGRPLTKGTGKPLADPSEPLVFPRNFNRISAPDSNSCSGCHNKPRSGGGGDIVANVFVLGQRFDHITFDPDDSTPTKGSHDERGDFARLDQIANSRATIGMFGSGYIEMLARQMTADLQAIRNALQRGQARELVTKGVHFGILARRADGSWDTSGVSGLPAPSLKTTGAGDPPNLILRPFHQAGAVVSLREFSNNAFNHHHGIQSTERFGIGTDPDGDGVVNEMTRADVTAVSVFQATLPVPGRVIPRDRRIERAVLAGEQRFAAVGCADCHVPRLPLTDVRYVEPNPYNPAGNLQPGQAPDYAVNLNSRTLPGPRLRAENGVTWVPAYTDLKLHDITSGPDDPNRESLDMLQVAGSDPFFAGNGSFLTKKLWGCANEPPFFHHGKYTTMRAAILAHAGEAQVSSDAFRALPADDQDAIIEFLKTLQVLPEGTRALVVDERGEPREWPPTR